MNDWKPGTLAMITGVDGSVLAFRQERQWATLNHLYFNDWQLSIVRPLAAIDPEDRGAVERLVKIWGGGTDDVPEFQAALREFAAPKPPRPDEPQGLGAVVEDAEGERWVRSHPGNKPWTRPHLSGVYAYADIDVVRVLSEGVR